MYVALQRPIAWPVNMDPASVWGLGDVQGAEQTVAIGGAAAGSAAAIGAAAGLIPAAAVPFIGPAIAGVTLLVSALVKNSGCGITCVETSQWANQAAAALDQNIAAYFAQSTRSRSSQQVALQNFDTIWSRLQQLCGQPGTGNAGVRCITDRQSGACVWRQTADKVPAWGVPPAGACWNWFSGYRDPIANDPGVVPDAAAEVVTTAAGSLLQSVGVSPSYAVPLLLVALLAVGLAVVN